MKTNDYFYVPLDEHVNVELLKSMNGPFLAKLSELAEKQADRLSKFSAGETLRPNDPKRTGVLTIHLRECIKGSYDDIHVAENYADSAWVEHFPELMGFISGLPFESYGRAFIIFDPNGRETPVHRDHNDPSKKQEFIWFTTNLNKRFFILDRQTNQKRYSTHYALWFNTRHYHGVEASGDLTVSVRVDGVFTHEFRDLVTHFQPLAEPRRDYLREKLARRLHHIRNRYLPSVLR